MLSHLDEGTWTLLTGNSERVLALQASSGGERNGRSYEVRLPNTGARVRLVFQDSPRLLGRVLREKGGPLSEFSINEEQVRAPDGRFSLPLTRFAFRRLFIGAPGFFSTMRRVDGAAGGEVDLETWCSRRASG